MQIEEPFAVLPMTGYCKAIQKDVQEVLNNTDGESRYLMCVACLHCTTCLRGINGWQAGTSLWRRLDVSCLWCRKHGPMELSVWSYTQASLFLAPFLAKLLRQKYQSGRLKTNAFLCS